ncbi:chemotaxis protein CheA [Alkalibacterium iburiense]|uniref:Chemotaxis protein CheA n=1 Tax=Alkalibacterium iburiense TaxID=290589 RepID=A0ABP3HFV3_9LACT
MEDNSAYRDLFFEETDENLAILNQEVLQLEQNPNDSHIIDAIFRAAHTLKGMAATMGYETMTHLTHAVENVFEQVKSGQLSVDTDLVSLIFETLDTLSDIVETIRMDSDTDIDISLLVERLEQVSTPDLQVVEEAAKSEKAYDFPVLEESDKVAIESAENSGYTLFKIGVRVEEESMMKAARAFLVISKLEQLGDFVQMKPSAEELEQGELEDSFALYLLSKEDKASILDHVSDSSEIEEVWIEEEKSTDSSESVEEKVVEKTERVKEKVQAKPTHSSSVNQTIRVDLSRLDQFMNLVSELVIHRTRLEDVSMKQNLKELEEPLSQVGRLTNDLQDLVLQLRMQKFSVVTQRFPRMMRDLTNELNKDINFVTEGEDTELDRTVISEIGEPLIHLLRNAADHGIEQPEERVKIGKDKTGTIRLSAFPEGNRVIVTITDDGKGLNPRHLEESARKKGISTEGLSDEELQQLIFHPGFSTANEVTGISGRGVGMDAVKEKITRLNGSIETISEVGKGTTFRITLPLTLSIIQSLLVKVSDHTFAIPQAVIESVNHFEESEAISVHQKEVYQYEGQTIPLVRVSEVLGLPEGNKQSQHIIVVQSGERFYGLIVNELIHQRETVIKNLGKEISHIPYYIGATILGDGSISLILDVSAVCTRKKVSNRG